MSSGERLGRIHGGEINMESRTGWIRVDVVGGPDTLSTGTCVEVVDDSVGSVCVGEISRWSSAANPSDGSGENPATVELVSVDVGVGNENE